MPDDAWPSWVHAQLHQRRIVLLRGPLDDRLAGEITAELMMLDATGDEAVALHVDSTGGPLEAGFTVIDTIDLLGVPVEAICVGRAEGSALGVVASAPRRRASPHARFRLSEPQTTIEGTASQMEAWAAHHQSQLARFVARLAQATGRPYEHLEADLAAGRWLNAEDAVAYGLVDELWNPASGPSGPPRLGFGPRN